MARPRQVTDEALVDAARAVFLEHGPHAALDRVAERLGVSVPAILKRVGTKEALLAKALCPADLGDWLARLRRGPGPGGVREQLVAVLREAHAAFGRVAPTLVVLRTSGIPFHAVFPADAPAPPRLVREALAAWLAHARDRGALGPLDPFAAADALLSAVEGHAFLTYVTPTPPDPAFVERLVDTFCNGRTG